MPTKYFCVTLIVVSGAISYLLIAVLFSYGIQRHYSYEPLLMAFVEPRPPNSYLREPRRLLESMCENDICLRDKSIDWTLVTFIKSKTVYFQRREFLRRTWASIKYMNGAKFETVFLMGKTDSEHIKSLLDEEEERYHDILQFDGPDDYNDMPHKVLAGMEWASRHLSRHYLYSSADDDFLIDMKLLVESVTNILKKSKRDEIRSVNGTGYKLNVPIMCMFMKGEAEQPMRRRGYKWYVSYREYRHMYYPPYCHGGMYVMSVPVATNLWNVSRTAPMLRLDDVWITGILRRRMNFPDELVFEMPKLATHFGMVSYQVRNKMSKQWREIVKRFENETICQCML